MNRREFVGASLLGTSALWAAQAAPLRWPRPLVLQESGPSPAQRSWMDLGFGLFIHFGINTFYDQEWSDGSLDAKAFNPTRLNTDQWMECAQAAGMKYVVLVTKHHDGFCLWPSAKTRYSVAASPFKKDVVEKLAKSAQKYGLRLGFYYSLWDRHEPSYEQDLNRYVTDFMCGQLQELLTRYGPVVELWFDGFWKHQKSGWTKKNEQIVGEAQKQERNQERDLAFIQAWRNEGAFHWQIDHVYHFVKSIQPDCLVMNKQHHSLSLECPCIRWIFAVEKNTLKPPMTKRFGAGWAAIGICPCRLKPPFPAGDKSDLKAATGFGTPMTTRSKAGMKFAATCKWPARWRPTCCSMLALRLRAC
ncbi:MAG: alpha-L-fucosidase [Cytophagales bacterium]|nr:alpha-L-fucosidase [Cytophagales bacterium]